MEQPTKRIRRGGIYFLPNALTTGALCSGFFAIVSANQGWFDWAAYAIFFSMLMDGLDGRVARWTNTQSDFGAQYDSLADMVSFGVAPALIMFEFVLDQMGKVGWVAAFIYTAAAALRLARFNTQIGVADKRFFQGLASPSAAGVVTFYVWVSDLYLPTHPMVNIIGAFLTISAGVLMVSNIRYHSFKGFDFRSKVPFVTLVAIVLIIAVVFSDPPVVLFSIFTLYAASGPLLTLFEIRRRRQERHHHGKPAQTTEPTPPTDTDQK
jgi:CDP-diacylglycerol--serine O-phosphatidyltransferase